MTTKVGVCFLRRLLPTTAKVQLVGELHLAEKIRVRRGGSARRGGCCRRPRRSSSSRRFVSLRRLLSTTAKVRLVAELQLAEEVLVRRGGPCWSAGGWRVLPADIRRRPRRSSSPRSLSLPRRFVLSVEVRLWPQRYGPACRGGSPTSGREGHDALDSSRWSCAAGCCMQHVQR